MRAWELARLAGDPFLLPLHRIVRRMLRALVAETGANRVVDVGGRRSPYTTGLGAEVTVTELPRRTAAQSDLDLGLDEEEIRRLRRRRSNIAAVVYDDMTRTRLPEAQFDGAIAVEVIEHVDDDVAFVGGLARVIRSGAWCVLTTPNAAVVPIGNPDHRRHYSAAALGALLAGSFERVDIRPVITDSRWHRRGLPSWRLDRPFATLASAAANAVSYRESIKRPDPSSSRHLLAVCWT
jgi:SAM-dependent methyltransferase